MEAWLPQYIGLPFLPRGRTREGLDCWGLVRLVLQEQYGKELPSYDGWYEDTAITFKRGDLVTQELTAGWQEIPPGQEQPGDLILLRVLGVPMHIGLVIGERRFLHIEQTINSCIESYESFGWSRRVLGFYRAP